MDNLCHSKGHKKRKILKYCQPLQQHSPLHGCTATLWLHPQSAGQRRERVTKSPRLSCQLVMQGRRTITTSLQSASSMGRERYTVTTPLQSASGTGRKKKNHHTSPVTSSVQEAGGTVTIPLQSVHQCGKAEEHYTSPHQSSESISAGRGRNTVTTPLQLVKMCRKGGECHASLHLIYMVFRPGPPSHWEAVVSSEWLLLPPELLPDWTRAKVKDMLALVQYFLSHFGVALKYKILEPIFSLTGYLNIHFACWGRTM